jgi:hypothetical protein
MNSKAETNAAVPANQDNAAQETSVKGEYASVGDLKMYYELTLRSRERMADIKIAK